MVLTLVNRVGGIKFATSAPAVAIARHPAIADPTTPTNSRQTEQRAERPEPPDRPEQNRPRIHAPDYPPIGVQQFHFRAQSGFIHSQSRCCAGRLQRQPKEAAPRKKPAPARCTANAEPAFAVIENPAPRAGSGLFTNLVAADVRRRTHGHVRLNRLLTSAATASRQCGHLMEHPR